MPAEPFPSIYPILDFDACAGRGADPARVLAVWREVGVELCQLRAKSLDESAYEAWAHSLRKVAPGMRFVANDHAVLALKSPDLFWGLHLGQEDLIALRSRWPAAWAELSSGDSAVRLGVSTHSALQIEQALRGPLVCSYIALGPVRPTASKPSGKDPVIDSDELARIVGGWIDLCAATGHALPITLVLIGGLDPASFPEVIRSCEPPGLNFVPVPAFIAAGMEPESLQEMMLECARLRLDRESTRHNLAEL